jgi:AAHS family 4-hydroxybenzoate transporter-like MFS transporter
VASVKEFDVGQLLDSAKVCPFTIRMLLVATIVIFVDGFDINNIGYVAPALAKAWQIRDMSVFGPVFGASLFGILFGAPAFGWIGDRFGRKKAIVIACTVFGLFTLATMLVQNVQQLIIIRILCGIGVGGVLPTTISLVAEFAPQRIRATLVILMFSGIGLGAAMPGPVAAWLVPQYGWQVLFLIGGAGGLAVALLAAVAMPESGKFLAVRAPASPALRRIMQAVRPDLAIGAETRFMLAEERPDRRFTPRQLFEDGRAPMTLLLWLLFVTNLMGYFFFINWTPLLLASANIPVGEAALATSLFQVGGLVGGWAICRPIDTRGFMPVTILLAVAVPVVAAIGYAGSGSRPLLLVLLFVAGFCVLGAQYAVNAVSGLIYPTAFRANGSGWAFAVGRVGSVSGPVVGGILVGMHLPVQQLYLAAALPFLIALPACFFFARRYNARFWRPAAAANRRADAESALGAAKPL